ncbi:amino acid deaminase [Inquilinus limosus]|uniref:amino acid deaminase n=1 Tax=Inquilinus limosus TaxID=171674 RepID=UPI0003F82654|nr:amino acid deaminase [Inquilinus limosus]
MADGIIDMLHDGIRGVPPGAGPIPLDEVAAQGWHPAEGTMSLPVLTLDEEAFAANRALMLRYAAEQGAAIAPHAKTPMAPALAALLVAAGAWGTTVADIRQAAVMLRAGLNRLILANQVGGAGGARRLARLHEVYPRAEIYVFVDSPEAAAALDAAWDEARLAPLPVLVEVGAGRAGARDLAAAERVIAAVKASEGRLRLAGIGAYEGAAATADAERTQAAIAGLAALAAEAFGKVRAAVGPQAPLILTAGGSTYFDLIVRHLGPVAAADGKARLVLRSGAIFFHDHGIYKRGLAALDARQGFRLGGEIASASEGFRPALRIWAEVLSRPEPGLAICGMGMRDVSHDQDLPTPLRLHRDGRPVHGFAGPDEAKVAKLNDQHAFLALDAGSPVAVGDVIEFGISHPCTCLDRWRVIWGVDGRGQVRAAYPTCFG